MRHNKNVGSAGRGQHHASVAPDINRSDMSVTTGNSRTDSIPDLGLRISETTVDRKQGDQTRGHGEVETLRCSSNRRDNSP